VVDNIASTFDGNEIDRSDVMQYLNGVALRLANEIGCAVVLLGHPAMGEKRIHSGSTAWLNGVRSSLVLKACSGGGLELCLTKSNYARPGQRIGMDFSATDYGPPFLVRDDSVLENDESDERTGSTKEDILMRILEEAMPDGLRHKDWLEKAEKEGIKAGTAKDLISKMSKKGKARKEDGVYRAPSQTSNVFRFEDLDLSRVAA
jgi:hypothetical protein